MLWSFYVLMGNWIICYVKPGFYDPACSSIIEFIMSAINETNSNRGSIRYWWKTHLVETRKSRLFSSKNQRIKQYRWRWKISFMSESECVMWKNHILALVGSETLFFGSEYPSPCFDFFGNHRTPWYFSFQRSVFDIFHFF